MPGLTRYPPCPAKAFASGAWIAGQARNDALSYVDLRLARTPRLRPHHGRDLRAGRLGPEPAIRPDAHSEHRARRVPDGGRLPDLDGAHHAGPFAAADGAAVVRGADGAGAGYPLAVFPASYRHFT